MGFAIKNDHDDYIELSDEQARLLEAQAAQHGRSVKEYLLDLATRQELSCQEWRSRLKGLTKLIPEDVPSLPEEALRRETMYRA